MDLNSMSNIVLVVGALIFVIAVISCFVMVKHNNSGNKQNRASNNFHKSNNSKF